MNLLIQYLSFACLLATATAQTLRDKCPKDEYACHDVMNGSQCIEQLIIEKLRPLTKESLAKCVEHEGTVTNLPGATKVCGQVLLSDSMNVMLMYDGCSIACALDAIPKLSIPFSKKCFRRHVR